MENESGFTDLSAQSGVGCGFGWVEGHAKVSSFGHAWSRAPADLGLVIGSYWKGDSMWKVFITAALVYLLGFFLLSALAAAGVVEEDGNPLAHWIEKVVDSTAPMEKRREHVVVEGL